MVSIIILWATFVYAVRHWPKRRYEAHTCIVLYTVLCSQNVFDVHAQMLGKLSDTEFVVLLCLYRSSLYINSRALTDCTDRVTVWMTLTLGGLRCEVRQFSDVISVIGRSFCGIFDSRYVELRTDILQETEILTICQFIRQTVHIHWEVREKSNSIRGYLSLFRRFCWKRPVQTERHLILLILTFHVFGFILKNCSQTNVFGNNVLTDRLVDPLSETRNKFFSFYINNCYNSVL